MWAYVHFYYTAITSLVVKNPKINKEKKTKTYVPLKRAYTQIQPSGTILVRLTFQKAETFPILKKTWKKLAFTSTF